MSSAISSAAQGAVMPSTPNPAPAQNDAPAAVANVDAVKVAQAVATPMPQVDIESAIKPTREAVAEAAKQIQQFISSSGRQLNFSVDESTGYHVVRVINPSTNEVVRQLPSDETLRIARQLEYVQSALVNQKA